MTFCDLVTALEALGLLKLEEPEPKTLDVPCLSGSSMFGETGMAMWGPGMATIRQDTLIETLRMAGYTVSKR